MELKPVDVGTFRTLHRKLIQFQRDENCKTIAIPIKNLVFAPHYENWKCNSILVNLDDILAIMNWREQSIVFSNSFLWT